MIIEFWNEIGNFLVVGIFFCVGMLHLPKILSIIFGIREDKDQ